MAKVIDDVVRGGGGEGKGDHMFTTAVRRAGATMLVLGVLAMLGAACGGDSSTAGPEGPAGDGAVEGTTDVSIADEGTPTPGGKLVYALEAETDGFDPTTSRWAISGLMVANAIFDPLMAYDENLVPQPYLLETSSHNEDYTEWTATLRKGVTFHDGTPFTADALVEFTNRISASVLTGPAARPIAESIAIDDYTVKTVMKTPWVAFPDLLTAQGGLVPALSQWAAGDAGKSNPVGTGPFKFVEWKRDSRLVVERNPNYWRKDEAGNQLPYLESVEFRIVPDAQSRTAALEAGSINALHTSSEEQITRMREGAADGRFQLLTDTGPQEKSVLMINTAKAPLDDQRLRKAMVMAIDRQQLATLNGADPERIIDGPISEESKWFADSEYPAYDPAGARALVDQVVAEKGPVTVTLGTTPTPDAQRVTQAVAAFWAEAGIDVQQRDYEQASFIVNVITGDYDVVLWRQYGAPDPDSEFHWWFSENAKGIGEIALNMSRVNDPGIDEALITGRENADEATRKEAYAQLQQRFAEVLPYAWLWETTWVVVADNTVRDITSGPLPDGTPSAPMVNGAHRLTHAWLSQGA